MMQKSVPTTAPVPTFGHVSAQQPAKEFKVVFDGAIRDRGAPVQNTEQ